MEKNSGKREENSRLLERHIAKLEEACELAQSTIEAVRDPFILLDSDLKIVMVNKAFYNTFSVSPEETLNKHIYAVGNRQWDIPKLRTLLESILPNNASFDDYVIEHDFPVIGRRMMVLNARRIPRPPAKPKIMLLVAQDITDMDKTKMTFEKMLDMELFSKVAREQKATIGELRNEVNALLKRLGEKLKYLNGNGKKKP